MGLDLRWPIGIMFFLIGLILVGTGLATGGSEMYRVSLGININLWWGVVLTVFGMVMMVMAWRDGRQSK